MKKPQIEKWSTAYTLPFILSTVLATAPVVAQDDDKKADDESPEEIVVTGIRGSLKSARDQKKNAGTAVDLITASDVSTLPDLSVAEALARVPGVVVQRIGLGASDGDFPSPEGGGNLVRGLTLVRSELNGRDAFSADGGRALDFGTIPPELIGSVQVFKNSSADLIQGGIGGTINLRTLEPFDKKEKFLVLAVDGTYTDLREKFTPDISAVAGNRWDVSTGEMGILGSYSRSELKSALHGFQIGQLYPITVDPSADALDPNAERIAVPGGFQLRTNEVDRKRESFYGALQYRNDDHDFEVILKYARIQNQVTSDERTLESFGSCERWAIQRPPEGDLTATDSSFSSPGLPICNGSDNTSGDSLYAERTFPVSGIYGEGALNNGNRDWTGARGAEVSNLGIHQYEESMTDDLSINIKWKPADNLYVTLDAHMTTATSKKERLWAGSNFFSDYYLRADLDNPEVRLLPRSDNNPWRLTSTDYCTVDWGGGPSCDGLSPLSPSVSDPDNTFLIFAADEFADNSGDLTAIKGDVQYDFDNDGWFKSVKFGARYSKRQQTNRTAGLNWAGLSPVWSTGKFLSLGALDTPGSEAVDFSNFFRGGVVTGDHTQVAFVDRALLSDYQAFADAMTTDSNFNPDWNPLMQNGEVDWSRGTVGNVTEKTTDFYVRFDLENEFDNGMSVDANFGVRYTNSTVSGIGQLDYVDSSTAATELFAPDTTAYMRQESIDRSGAFNDTEYWLPSVNVKLNLDDEQLIRFAASKAITRPNISQLKSAAVAVPSLVFESDPVTNLPSDIIPTQINIWGGNPDLKAIQSWNIDLSYEYYWGDQNSLTFSLFYKDITDNIIYESETLDVIELDGVQVPVVFNGDLNQDKAEIKGFEVAYQQFYDHLPGLLGNLGLQANYTYIDAKTAPPTPVDGADGDPNIGDDFSRVYRFGVNEYLGLSKHTFNVIGIYQDDQFEFRLAYNWRSGYVSSYRDFVTGNPIFQKDRGYLDGSFKYTINDNIQFRLHVANILDTVAKADQQIDATGQMFGRTAFMGDRRIRAGLLFQF